MKNISNAYLVLSVADIRALLHAAKLEQQVRGEHRETVTIVLEGITVNCEGADRGNPQIASWSVVAAAKVCATQSLDDIAAQQTANATLTP